MVYRKIAEKIAATLSLASDVTAISELELSVRIVEQNPSITVEEMHETFIAQRITEGFVQTPDPERTEENQILPRPVRSSLVVWDDLPKKKQHSTRNSGAHQGRVAGIIGDFRMIRLRANLFDGGVTTIPWIQLLLNTAVIDMCFMHFMLL